jgi:hypothetical protein
MTLAAAREKGRPHKMADAHQACLQVNEGVEELLEKQVQELNSLQRRDTD